MKEGYVKMTMDVPRALRIKIRESAARNDRPMGVEVCARLAEVYGLSVATSQGAASESEIGG